MVVNALYFFVIYCDLLCQIVSYFYISLTVVRQYDLRFRDNLGTQHSNGSLIIGQYNYILLYILVKVYLNGLLNKLQM